MLARLARWAGVTCWEVLHWPPERVTLERTCMLAMRAHRQRVLSTTDEHGRKPSIMVTLDVDDLGD